ncbi:MAG: transglycosylase family protein [Solirubrobacteraceae bacterium]|nr:transglycosylase family protein [Solirubrobacteraceae bacterium]
MPASPHSPHSRSRLHAGRRALAIAAAAVVGPLALWSAIPLGATGATQGEVENRIERGKSAEQSLSSAAARLARLEKITARGVAVLERRQAEAQADVDRWEARLRVTETRLKTSRKRLGDQQRRLEKNQSVLGAQLRATYMSGTPDLATIVLDSDGLEQVLDTVEYEQAARQANQRILKNVKQARAQTQRLERSLQKIVPEQREATQAVRRERDAVAQRSAALAARRAALAQAKAARLQALKATRTDRRRAERTLRRLVAAQQKASVDKSGPGGPWAIPWAIVQCESGGQNTPPNSAGASGYYQFIPSTWKALGGSTNHAYQAGKAEQDRLAAKLWAGGAGARNWDCAAIVGLI